MPLYSISRTVKMHSAVALVGLTLAACGGGGGGGGDGEAGGSPAFKALELNIAHINDHHSQLDANPSGSPVELTLDGVATQVDQAGFARQTAMFKSLASSKNLLKIHAGDAMTGTLYHTFFKGAADAAMMNTICFDAFIPGNHEFDDGDSVLKGFLDELAKGSCKTPTLSANIVPAAGSPLSPDYLKPYLVKEIDGVKVGIVGITVAGKTVNSSRPLASTVFNDETSSAQKAIDELKAKGIRHIVAVTHLGYDADKALAAKLTDVDVIIGGDSHTLLGDFSSIGLKSSGSYPTVVTNKSGETVCIGQAWEYAKATGVMNVQFNESGAVKSCGGKATLLIGDNFKRKDATGAWQAVSDTVRTSLMSKLANSSVTVLTPDATAAATLKTYSDQMATEKAKVIGNASESLCLVRVPGESTNRSAGVSGCETANTLARGSDAAQVVAEAFLSAAKRADFSLQNAGGVRVPVSAGSLTMNTAFTLLPYTNVLIELDIKGAEMVAALEDAVDNIILNPASATGSYPYAAGLRWDIDMSKAKGQRFSNVQVRDKTTGAWTALDLAKTYVLVTNDFVAEGKDGYATLGAVSKSGRSINTYLLYTQSFVDYVRAKGNLARPARADYSNQVVMTAAGVRLP